MRHGGDALVHSVELGKLVFDKNFRRGLGSSKTGRLARNFAL
jgi:hypothetical protein